MHERVPRTFYFVVSSPGGVAETIFHVNFTLKHKVMSNSVDDDDEELSEPEEIHFPVFGSAATTIHQRHGLSAVALMSTIIATIANKYNDLFGVDCRPPKTAQLSPPPPAPPSVSILEPTLLVVVLFALAHHHVPRILHVL